MTWKEFKTRVELLGVKDDSKISYIDISEGYPDIEVEEEDGKYKIS